MEQIVVPERSKNISRAEVRSRVGGSDYWASAGNLKSLKAMFSNFFRPTAQAETYFTS